MTEQAGGGSGPVVRGERHQVELTLPCPGCTHAPICRIKPSLEAATATISMPAFDGGVTFKPVAIALDCEYRTGARKAKAGRNWSPEQRAAAGERMRERNAAKVKKAKA